MRHACIPAVAAALVLSQVAARADCLADRPSLRTGEENGRRWQVEDVSLANSLIEYTLRTEFFEDPDDPNAILPKKWAPTIGYTPLGIAGPSMALWYNQGFMQWTFDDMNLRHYRPRLRVMRAEGADGRGGIHLDHAEGRREHALRHRLRQRQADPPGPLAAKGRPQGSETPPHGLSRHLRHAPQPARHHGPGHPRSRQRPAGSGQGKVGAPGGRDRRQARRRIGRPPAGGHHCVRVRVP